MGSKGFGSGGGVGGSPGMEQIFCRSQRVQKEEKLRFLKDALWGGGGTHRSWPGGRGGRPRALVAGEGWGGRRGWMAVKEGLFQRGASPGKGWLAWQFHRRGQGLGGESKGFGSGRVGVLFFES